MLSTLLSVIMVMTPQLASIESHKLASTEAPMSKSHKSTAYPIDGVDVASWQHPQGKAINWSAVKGAGVDFATVKATEGSATDNTDYTNPWFGADLTGARTAGIPVAPYHFYLGRTADTGVDQAQHFITVLRQAGYTGQRPLDLPPILDFEWDWKTAGCPPHATVTDVQDWLDEVEEAFGRQPIIYTNRNFISGCMGNTTAFSDYPLQVAHYASTPPATLPAGWKTWLIWQWTSTESVPGIPSQYVTRSALNGTRADLGALAGTNTGQ